MLEFKDKLSFLMQLTNTKNSQLAATMMVDPSLISRIRSGKRQVTQNSEYLKLMSEYLASRCSTRGQRLAITEIIGKDIDTSDKAKVAQAMESWLRSNEQEYRTNTFNKNTKEFLRTFNTLNLPLYEEISEEIYHNKSIKKENTKIYSFYGVEGRKQATLLFEELVLSAETATEVKLLTEGNTDWLWTDKEYSSKVTSNIKEFVRRGGTITEIIPMNQGLSMSFASVKRWFVPYMVGRINPYYYSHIRDNVFNITIYNSPGIVALISTTVNDDIELTNVTTNHDMVTAIDKEYDKYLKLCKPATTLYNYDDDPSGYRQCVTNFFQYQSDFISIMGEPSFVTSPIEIFPDFHNKERDFTVDNLQKEFELRFSGLERLLHSYSYYEIMTLDSLEDVISGKVRYIAPSLLKGELSFYTPNIYICHLKNIIKLLEKYPNYHVILLNKREFETTIFIKKDYGVLIFSHKQPYILTNIEYKDIVDIIYEYSKNTIEKINSKDKDRRTVIATIKQKIKQIEDYLHN